MRVELVEQTTEVGLLDRLAEGALDAVFTEGPLGPGPFASETPFVDPYRRMLRQMTLLTVAQLAWALGRA